MKSSGFKDAPPTKTPSTFGIDIIWAAFEPLTLAPYKTGVPPSPIDVNVSAINLCAVAISVSVGVRPAPIAHRGSYAMMMLPVASVGTDSRTPDSMISIVFPACFSSIVSPTQIMGVRPFDNAIVAF